MGAGVGRNVFVELQGNKAAKAGWSQITKDPELNKYCGFYSADNGKPLKNDENEHCWIPPPPSHNSGDAK